MTTVADANGTTHFFDVYGGQPIVVKKGPPVVVLPPPVIGSAMLFIPQAVTLVEHAPMLVYYHGHNGSSSIEGYVNAMKQRDFRPLLREEEVLLVEPWGGVRSKFGELGNAAGLGQLIKGAMAAALRLRPPARRLLGVTPYPRSLILAGFSGGGATLKKVVIGSKADYIGLLSEVWCFDCMYSGEGQAWVDWAKANTMKKMLRVRVASGEGTGSPRAQADVIRNAMKQNYETNIDIADVTPSGHEDLPGKFIQDWL